MESRNMHSRPEPTPIEADPGPIRRIRLDFDDAEVLVGSYDRDCILLQQTEERDERRRLQTEVTGDLLTARIISSGPLWLQRRAQIRVMLPAAYCGELSVSVRTGETGVRGLNLARIDCAQRSGRLQIIGCTAASLEAEVHSGRIEIANVDTGDLVLRSASGDICCERVVCSTLRADSLSGRQDLDVHAAAACTLSAKSGALRFTGSTPELKTDTKSGSQHLTADGLKRADLRALSGTLELSVPEGPDLTRIDLSVVSGRADLRLPAETMPIIDLQAVQGGCRCRSADFTADGHPVQIQARMTSGQLRVVPWAADIA